MAVSQAIMILIEIIMIPFQFVQVSQLVYVHINYNDTLMLQKSLIIECACFIDGSLKTDGSMCTSFDPCPCDSNGSCKCGIGYAGDKCDECEAGYFDLDGNGANLVASCSGNQINTDLSSWNSIFWFRIYVDCGCNYDGSLKSDGSTCLSSDSCPCDSNGFCTCQSGYTGDKCNECETGYYDVDGDTSDDSATCAGNYINIDINQLVISTKKSN